MNRPPSTLCGSLNSCIALIFRIWQMPHNIVEAYFLHELEEPVFLRIKVFFFKAKNIQKLKKLLIEGSSLNMSEKP